ncbi:MAG: hypothetical protein J0H25_17270 [Rhizobiales bacterium]|nr:hypothetical protein [Hyphomicrobiales bacterium]
MGDTLLAIIGVVAGGLAFVSGIIVAARSSRAARSNEAFIYSPDLRTLALQVVDERFPNLSPKERDELADRIARSIAADIPPDLRRRYESPRRRENNSEQPHQKQLPKTVEVQRADGSTITLGVDPTDASSVSAFLDSVRINRGERVLAVH